MLNTQGSCPHRLRRLLRRRYFWVPPGTLRGRARAAHVECGGVVGAPPVVKLGASSASPSSEKESEKFGERAGTSLPQAIPPSAGSQRPPVAEAKAEQQRPSALGEAVVGARTATAFAAGAAAAADGWVSVASTPAGVAVRRPLAATRGGVSVADIAGDGSFFGCSACIAFYQCVLPAARDLSCTPALCHTSSPTGQAGGDVLRDQAPADFFRSNERPGGYQHGSGAQRRPRFAHGADVRAGDAAYLRGGALRPAQSSLGWSDGEGDGEASSGWDFCAGGTWKRERRRPDVATKRPNVSRPNGFLLER